MAKKTALAIFFLLAASFLSFAAEPVQPDCEDTTKTAMTIDELADHIEGMFQLKIKELEFNLTPTFKIVLPDTSTEMGIKHKMGETTLEGMTKYNYIYSQIFYSIKYTLDVITPVSFSLYDDIKLESIYEQRKYLQKVKGFAGGVETPVLFDVFKLREELASETFYVAQLQDPFEADEGNLLILRSYFEANFKDSTKERVFLLKAGIENSIPYEGNIYNYILLSLESGVFFRFPGERDLSFTYKGGYLLENYNLPLWKRYKLGGYDRLIGYNFDEFAGRYFVSGRLRYDFRVFDRIDWVIPLLEIKSLSMFLIGDIGCAGNSREIMGLGNYKYSAGLGVVFDVTFRKKTKMKVTLAIGQAIEQGRLPVFYLIHEI